MNYYVTLLDTQNLIINKDKANFGPTENKALQRRPTLFKYINQVENPPRKQNISQKKSNQINNALSRLRGSKNEEEEINIYKMGNKSNKIQTKNGYRDNNASNDSENIEEAKQFKNAKYSVNKPKKDISIEESSNKEDSQSNNDECMEEKSSGSERNEKYKKNKNNSAVKRPKFNFLKYIGYQISCGSNDKVIKYYENIREKLISEENIIQNYLDTYELLKLNGIPKKSFIRNKL